MNQAIEICFTNAYTNREKERTVFEKDADFPKVTVILRGYDYEQCRCVVSQLVGTKLGAVEVAMNTPGAAETIRRLVDEFGHDVRVHFVLVVLFVHPNVVRIGEVGVRDFLAFEDEVFELVVGAEHRFRRRIRQKVLHLHLDGGGAAAALRVFRLHNDHRILANHEDVAKAQFLCGFHDFNSLEMRNRGLAGFSSCRRTSERLEKFDNGLFYQNSRIRAEPTPQSHAAFLKNFCRIAVDLKNEDAVP